MNGSKTIISIKEYGRIELRLNEIHKQQRQVNI